ncbi:MAG: M1 family aminopeptidase [candidate division KSB1 bacterium]|nr:M1 family aminopeptidase [candidate division KSB1 bacterium]MDZ7317596.1 M1 family aminopeptidase [candidate division KSB1 bacterium]MDZ7340307.1 M1 family aminopeptidase [candidate division KSB1 bacterium]
MPIYKVQFERKYDTQHIKLILDLDLEQKSLIGDAIITLLPQIDTLRSFQLHAKNMAIQQITLADQRPLSFVADSETVTIHLGQAAQESDTITIVISYFTRPMAGLYFNLPSDEKPQLPYQIYTHSEPISARYWFPCYDEPDDKVTSEIIATVPDNFFLLSNGRLLSTIHDRKLKTKTFHWYQDLPHATYLMCLTAGEYVEIRDQVGTTPLQYYVYPQDSLNAANSFAQTPRMLTLFERLFGYRYPWAKYAQIVVADYQAGGMEHTSATTLNDNTIHDRRAHLDADSDELVAHELAHQWFGNLVTCRSWTHLWLNEGFATYAEVLYQEFGHGLADAQHAIHDLQKTYFELVDPKFPQPIVYEAFLHPDDLFNHLTYQKAALVLHMLRNVIGDSLFFASLKTYLQHYAFGVATTADFQQVVSEVSRQNLDWFFDQWLFHGGHPQLTVHSRWLADTRELWLLVQQTQTDSLGLVPLVYRMPVTVEIVTPKERLLHQVWLSSRSDTFKFTCNEAPLMLQFDPENYLLKEVKCFKSQDEWLYQLQHASNVASRLTAIERLQTATFDTLATIGGLESALLNDPYWAVRQQAAYALIDFHRPETKGVLRQACRDAASKVRSAAILALSYYYDANSNPLFRELARNDSSYNVVADALYALANVPDDSSFDVIKNFLDLDSRQDIVRTAAFHCLSRIKDERAIPLVLRFAMDQTQPAATRSNALSVLREVGGGHADVESSMVALLSDRDPLIQKKAIDILGQFKTTTALQALKQLQELSLPDDVRRRLRTSIQKIEQSIGAR